MKVKCPNCQSILESDEDIVGCVVDCPECGNEFTAQRITAKAVCVKRKGLPLGNKIADYSIGLLFGIVGIIIASCTDGPQGAKLAARGCVIHIAIAIGLFLISRT